jgi:hypothetical protein
VLRTVGLAALAFVAISAITSACVTTSDVRVYTPSEAWAHVSELDGARVSIRGFARVSNEVIGIKDNSDVESECVGLLILEDEFDSARAHDRRWVMVTGVFDAEGCDPATHLCHDICGPAVVVEPTFED